MEKMDLKMDHILLQYQRNLAAFETLLVENIGALVEVEE